MARLQRRDVVTWQLRGADATEADKPALPALEASRVNASFLPTFELGVEVSQTNDDQTPLAIAYMDIDPATLPPPPAPPAVKPPTASVTVNAPSTPRVGFNLEDPFSARR